MDLSRRLPHYLSDYYDSRIINIYKFDCIILLKLVFKTHNGSQKVLSTAIFLYFACLLPSIAFGVLNSQATKNQISAYKTSRTEVLSNSHWEIL
jgi:sodium borate transporter 11